MSDYTPQPGDIGLRKFAGPLGPVITALQGLVAGDWSRFSHAFVVVNDHQIVQAGGHGVQWAPMPKPGEVQPLAWLRFPDWGDRQAALDEAYRLLGTPYSYASYLWIGLAKLGIRPKWLRNEIASDHRLICSAFADRVWMAGGVNAFDDGRLLGAVTPGDLAYVGTVINVAAGPWRAAA